MKLLVFSFIAGALAVSPAFADESVFTLTIQNHRFSPETLEVPAGQKVKLLIKNQDATAEEFESHDLNREKVVAANGEITIYVGPLDAGEYHYFGDFHQDTAKGTIIVK